MRISTKSTMLQKTKEELRLKSAREILGLTLTSSLLANQLSKLLKILSLTGLKTHLLKIYTLMS
jgi:hypothetical protein